LFQITPSVTWNDASNDASKNDKQLVQLKNDENKSDAFLAAGNAERTFFTVCGSNASKKRHYERRDATDDDDDDEDEEESDDENVAQRRRLISDDDEAGKCVRASIQETIQKNVQQLFLNYFY
jgi:hypothetical protein